MGDPLGPLVIHNHGGPSSRLEARLFADVATRHGLRFLCVDRPGYGQSSPQRTPAHASWADDLTTIADTLGYREFGVTGWSGGGPSALAAAAYIDPARLRHVTCISGGNYGTFGDNWAADQLSKIDALGACSPCTSSPVSVSCMPRSASRPNIFARPISINCARRSATTIDRSCCNRGSRPPSATRAPSALRKGAMGWSATRSSTIGTGPSM
ncbi:MAG: alpha/beta fold hydrolase [Pirellulales bacterium]|nr:alpha/beta fold hydrolase [Pirellulales bacterium]